MAELRIAAALCMQQPERSGDEAKPTGAAEENR